MAVQIIHGIGKAILRDFKDSAKVIAMTNMQDLSLESGYSTDDITGGNKMFPIASFKQDQTLNGSATNATFNADLLPYLDGADVAKNAKVTLSDIMEVAIPEELTITLDVEPTNVFINGFEKGESAAAGTYSLAGSVITFAEADKGKVVEIVYDYESNTATEYSVTQTSMSKPFAFDYIFPIYDEDTQITHKGLIKIYKAQCTSGFSINPQHRTAFAPKFEFSARDAKRADGKMWSLFIDGVAVGN